MKKIITGATILTGAIAMANDNVTTTNSIKKETVVDKDPIYRVIPRGSKVSLKGKKIIISNGNSMCSADKDSTKAAKGKVLKDIKCSVSKADPNYNFWKKLSKIKNLKVYDKWTQEEIMKKIEDIEEKYVDSKTKVDDVEGSTRLYFDMNIIKPKTESKTKEVAKKVEPKAKPLTNKKEEPKKEASPKVKKRIIYIKEEISKKNTKSNEDTDVDKIIKGIADRIAKES